MKIAFGYKMRSGKDTAVDYMISKYGGNKITFAKYLYQSLYSTQEIFNLEKKKNREYLQIVGDWARKQNPDIFVDLALSETKDVSLNYFCNDLRFLNEFKKLKKNGWICIKIIRDECSEKSSHFSETELDIVKDEEWDFIIENNNNLEDFYKKLDDILS